MIGIKNEIAYITALMHLEYVLAVEIVGWEVARFSQIAELKGPNVDIQSGPEKPFELKRIILVAIISLMANTFDHKLRLSLCEKLPRILGVCGHIH
jgi:hypothetical protein